VIRLKPDQTTFYNKAFLKGFVFVFLIFYTHIYLYAQLVDVSGYMSLESNHLGGFLGTGVSFVDFNNDGYDDVTLGHYQGDIRFYQGNGEGFSEVFFNIDNGVNETKGVAWVDLDNDSDLDFLVTNRLGANKIWINENMIFTDVSATCGINQSNNTKSYGMSFADYNNDGFVDFYICNYHTWIDAIENELYLNNGNGTFTQTTEIAGVGNGFQQSFQSTFLDINNDGFQDLHVINDRLEMLNAFYINNGDGTFSDKAALMGLDIGIYAMSSSFGDFDRDGDMDLYVTNGSDGNVLFENQFLSPDGIPIFNDVTLMNGVGEYEICWAAEWIDFDNDILLDLFVTSGVNLYSDYPAILDNFPEVQNSLYKNNGIAFYDLSANLTQWPNHSFAVAQGDFNNDGFPDLVSHQLGSYAQMLRGTPSNNNWIKIKLRGTNSNSFGIGSKITLNCVDSDGVPFSMSDVVISGENYMGQNSYWQNFGLKDINHVESITVNWSGGEEEVFLGPFDSNQHLQLIEGGEEQLDELGCKYPGACNYSEAAIIDDGSCDLSCLCGEGTVWDELNGNCVINISCASDIDSSGQIDINDLLLILVNFGMECPE
tara:strand:+ start:565 stop:2358 length:1794 start_codon:yes stop_codon:yes gene_type:complete